VFTNILVAVDGSEISIKTLETALSEAKVWNAKLNVIHILETGLFTDIPADANQTYIRNLLEQQGLNVFSYAEKRCEEEGLNLNTLFGKGHAGIEIIAAATDLHADLIVLGSHGKSDIDTILLGSVSQHVVQHSPVSTLVVRT
jgi:nucleotide-binding universal stress UspA family protein